MNSFFDMLKKIYPNILDDMQQRYMILHYIDMYQPVGRRTIAEVSHITERVVRREVEFLQNQGLIFVTSKGMQLTKEGTVVVEQLAKVIRDITGVDVLEKRIREKLHIDHVIIVSGDSDHDEWVKHEMGKACVSYLKKVVKPGYTIAVTGGTTMATVAEVMTPFDGQHDDYLFVPARGGIGEKVESQANTIAAEMAKRAHAAYRMLFVPDLLSEKAYETVLSEPAINEILEQIRGANIVLHGVGDALTMATRRNASETSIEKLMEHGAVGEAFGYYFDKSGNVIHKVRTVGLQLEDLTSERHVITVAGGKSKGQAILSYFKNGKSNVLITDEAVAEQLLRESSL